jgi:hypothetical protein
MKNFLSATNLLLFAAIIGSCGTTQMYSGPELPEDQIALVTAEGGKSIWFVDGDETDHLVSDTVSVLPGPHVLTLHYMGTPPREKTLTDLYHNIYETIFDIGYTNMPTEVSCSAIKFVAEAGVAYEIRYLGDFEFSIYNERNEEVVANIETIFFRYAPHTRLWREIPSGLGNPCEDLMGTLKHKSANGDAEAAQMLELMNVSATPWIPGRFDGTWKADGSDWTIEMHINGNRFQMTALCRSGHREFSGRGTIDKEGSIQTIKLSPAGKLRPKFSGNLERMILYSSGWTCSRDELNFKRA